MSAYAHCACRDCFATVIMGDRFELCDECCEAGCRPYNHAYPPARSAADKYDCQCPGAYASEPGGMGSDRED